MSSFDMTRRFHVAMELPAPDELREPTLEERVLRASLLIEEAVETVVKGLGLRVVVMANPTAPESEWVFNVYDEGCPYDPIETLDGLADVKVIANGMAVQFGLPMEAADREIFESNMSKLDGDGKPINNECMAARVDPQHDCTTDECRLRDDSQPAGKLLKGPNFIKPNIAGLLESVCPEHMASAHSPKVCGRCGTHMESLR